MVQVLVQVLVRGLSSSDFGSGFGSGNLFMCWTIGQAVWAWHAERAGSASMACMADWAGSDVCMHVLIVNVMADRVCIYIYIYILLLLEHKGFLLHKGLLDWNQPVVSS